MEKVTMAEKAALGCLLIHDITASQSQVKGICHVLEARGYPVGVANLLGFVPRDQYDRTPRWQRWLTQAQEAYVELLGVCEKVVVVGVGNGGAIATVLAEQYFTEGLVVIGSVLRMRRKVDAFRRFLPFVSVPGTEDRNITARDMTKLIRLSENNLFSIVCDVLVLQTSSDELYDPAGGKVLLKGVRSPNARAVELIGAKIESVCETHEEHILDEITEFLQKHE